MGYLESAGQFDPTRPGRERSINQKPPTLRFTAGGAKTADSERRPFSPQNPCFQGPFSSDLWWAPGDSRPCNEHGKSLLNALFLYFWCRRAGPRVDPKANVVAGQAPSDGAPAVLILIAQAAWLRVVGID